VIDKLIQVNPSFYLCYYTLDFDPVRIKFKLDIICFGGDRFECCDNFSRLIDVRRELRMFVYYEWKLLNTDV
jgi:hypothetical protein